jgi:hypothetical protein
MSNEEIKMKHKKIIKTMKMETCMPNCVEYSKS